MTTQLDLFQTAIKRGDSVNTPAGKGRAVDPMAGGGWLVLLRRDDVTDPQIKSFMQRWGARFSLRGFQAQEISASGA